ncbi:ATP-binding protein [Streptomyces sp. NPDC001774]
MTSTLAPSPVRHLPLDTSPAPARTARHAVQDSLEEHGICCTGPATGDCAQSILLIVSELVTNATRHSHGPQEMRIRWNGPQITLEVDDDLPTIPRIRPEHERGETGGFGMDLIDQLSDTWGTHPRPCHRPGKTVYVRITTTA